MSDRTDKVFLVTIEPLHQLATDKGGIVRFYFSFDPGSEHKVIVDVNYEGYMNLPTLTTKAWNEIEKRLQGWARSARHEAANSRNR